VNSALTRRKGNFLSHKVDKCEGLISIKRWKGVGNSHRTVWTKDLKFGVNSALTRRKENFLSHKVDKCEGLSTIKC
jgi:hypothetical protein